MVGTFGTDEQPLTVGDLLEELCDLPLDTVIYVNSSDRLTAQACENVQLLLADGFIYGVMLS